MPFARNLGAQLSIAICTRSSTAIFFSSWRLRQYRLALVFRIGDIDTWSGFDMPDPPLAPEFARSWHNPLRQQQHHRQENHTNDDEIDARITELQRDVLLDRH